MYLRYCLKKSQLLFEITISTGQYNPIAAAVYNDTASIGRRAKIDVEPCFNCSARVKCVRP